MAGFGGQPPIVIESAVRELPSGLSVSYCTRGTGPALVLLHGIGSNAQSWSGQIDGFAKRFRVIAWNAPGYADSTELPKQRPSVIDYAQVLNEFLSSLQVESCCIVGHSLGALIASAFAAKFDNKVNAMVLANSAMGYNCEGAQILPESLRHRVLKISRQGPEKFAEERAPRLLSENASEETKDFVQANMTSLSIPGYVQAAWMLAQADITSYAASIAVPTLVLTSSCDEVMPSSGSKRLAEKIPHCNFASIAGAGHASYLEAPKEFNWIVSEFLSASLGSEKSPGVAAVY